MEVRAYPGSDHSGGRLEIDLSAIGENYKLLSNRSAGAETAAAVKADAYGLGLDRVAPVLFNHGCRTFFVALPEEGAQLRQICPDATIYVLAGIWPEMLDMMRVNRLTPVLNSLQDVALWQKSASGSSASFALHIDTGMNRLGLSPGHVAELHDLKPDLIMSHFACADDPGHPLNQRQVDSFNEIRRLFPQARASLANSAAILSREDCRFDLTRPGISLYGGTAVNGQINPMRRVVKLYGRIAQIRHIKAGESIGYGATHVFERDSRVATVAVGYADGYHRAASGSGVPLRKVSTGGHGFINGQTVPVVGRLSMDLTGFDLTGLPAGSVAQGDWIELIGNNLPLGEVAVGAGTIDYEILTSLGRRFARTYAGG